MNQPDSRIEAAVRAAVMAEAAAAPGPGDLWDRTRRRVRRRRVARVTGGLGAAVLVVIGVVAGIATLNSSGDETRFEEGTGRVAVGGASIVLPEGWELLDARGATPGSGPCPEPRVPTVWLRDRPQLGVPVACTDQARDALQVAPAGDGLTGAVTQQEGTTTSVGSVPAWHAVLEARGSGDAESEVPRAEVWVAPAADLWAQAPVGLDAEAVLATVRPEVEDPDGVMMLVTERGSGDPDRPVEYAAIDARGQRLVWFTEPTTDDIRSSHTRYDWPGLTPERFAVAEATLPHGLRVVAGRPGGGHVPWERRDAADGLTEGSYPQVAWSPDGTAVAWYAPRGEPVMGLAQWEDLDALADGAPPAWEQTVPVAAGPVQVGPAALRWEAADDGAVLVLVRGLAAPLEGGEEAGPWRLDVTVDASGRITLPEPAAFEPVSG